MKSRIVTMSESEIRRQVKMEYQKIKDTVYENVIKDVIPQFTAVCLCVLNREYGFGMKRLKRFLDSVNSEFEIMDGGFLGRNYDPLDCLKFLKDKYEIDVDKELNEK